MASFPKTAGELPSTRRTAQSATGQHVGGIAVALLVLIAAAGVALLSHASAGQPHPRIVTQRRPGPRKSLTMLPLSAQSAVSATLGARDRGYWLRAAGSGFVARSSAQHLSMRFAQSRVQVSSGDLQFGLSLRAAGYGSSLGAVGASKPIARADRVSYPHAAMNEWYVNGPLGLEQGFTLARPPVRRDAGPLTLSLGISGNARPALAADRRSLTLRRAGSPPLRYGGLIATDAHGRPLHTQLALSGGRLLLRVWDRGAVYPLTVDPFIRQGPKLTASGEAARGVLGDSAALSADGDTALIGAPGDTASIPGAAYVFQRSGGIWAQQGPALLPSGGASEESEFGSSVALSADGSTALVGSSTGSNTGGAWVFVRSGTTWEQQGPKLTSAEEVGEGYFGYSVALSADGNTALIGAPGDAGNGAAWVFVRAQGSWAQQGHKLTSEPSVAQVVGYHVALSGDGKTALLGAYGPGKGTWGGAALVFTRSGESWTQQGPALNVSEVGSESLSGWSVALSADGSTALVGDVAENGFLGAAWVFTRSGSSWTQSARLSPTDESGSEGFGQSVSLSGAGDTALVGGPGYNGSRGAAWIFRRSDAAWNQQGAKLTDSGEIPPEESQFGVSVALSSDGQTALVSDPTADGGLGAAFAFVEDEPAPPTVTGVSPNEGRAAGGTPVAIAGTDLGETTAVDFGSHPATSFTVNSATSITATAPAGVGTVDVTVTTLQGTSPTSSADRFTYVPTGPTPTIKKLSPNKGAAGGGASVTITGTDLTGTSTVKFGSTNATSFTVNSATSITAVSPAGVAKAVDVTVTSPNGTSAVSSLDHFRLGPPTVTGVSPSSGSKAGSANVTITGTGFGLGTEATSFKFGTTEVTTVECSSATTCVVAAPSHAVGTVEVKATVSGMASLANPPGDSYTYG